MPLLSVKQRNFQVAVNEEVRLTIDYPSRWHKWLDGWIPSGTQGMINLTGFIKCRTVPVCRSVEHHGTEAYAEATSSPGLLFRNDSYEMEAMQAWAMTGNTRLHKDMLEIMGTFPAFFIAVKSEDLIILCRTIHLLQKLFLWVL
ncbi:MAG: hypothetical protein FDX30_04355 [Chlorobium sp.]|nr:MAG: hypothetical protein FDX30_04355 [Chlorobium sp.]